MVPPVIRMDIDAASAPAGVVAGEVGSERVAGVGGRAGVVCAGRGDAVISAIELRSGVKRE